MSFRYLFSFVGLVLVGCSGRLDVGDRAPGGPTDAVPDLARDRAAMAGYAPVVALGTGHACAILEDATVACWGFNRYGQTGVRPEDSLDPNGTPYINTPTRVPGLDHIVQISAGWQSSYALRADGKVFGWGGASWTPEKNDAEGARNVPKEVPGLSDVVKIADGGDATCVLRRDGSVICWGASTFLDVSPSIPSGSMQVLPPTPVPGITDAVDLTVEDGMSCVIHRDGDVSCWGNVQIVTDEYTRPTGTPVRIPGVHKVVEVAIAQSAAIALLADGTVMGWGADDAQTSILGELHGSRDPRVTSYDDGVPPGVFPGLSGIASVRAQYRTMCALVAADGSVFCWGRNDVGELGQGRTTTPISQPTRVEGVTAMQIEVGTWNSCFIDAARRLVCWGNGTSGALGTGMDEKYASKPSNPVLLPAPLAPSVPRAP